MNEPTPTTETLIAELLAATPGGGAGHPPPERLLAYRAGELAAPDEGAVQDHLVACRACTAVLLDLAELEAAARGEAGPGTATTAAGRGSAGAGAREAAEEEARGKAAADAMRATVREGDGNAADRGLAEGAPAPHPPGPTASDDPVTADFGRAAAWRRLAPHLDPPASDRRRSWRSPALAWAVAAALAVVVVGLGLDRARLERAAGGAGDRQPAGAEANVPVLYLDPTTRADTVGQPLSLAAGAGSVVVIASPDAGTAGPPYRLLLVDAGGRTRVAVLGLRRSDYGTLRATLPRPPAGRYELRVEGRVEAGWVSVGAYPLHVHPPPP
ncbi:MAG TPA: hypothetical protein VHQ65_05555 [Thermoanaerobaculia bacterium]|nr:hypothetical protein [Thermoanaerobaculia bacterium]